ncbi:hypothetical protein H6F32_04430 [Anabaena sp. FACHB-1237]|uniref:hypothetical protein n=1 Tax=Anabaena sp. FACHB-1237 TaxID=2692769 RepID=UPI001680B5C3|nr:hypothetical protein [Anabaena sp. FACHB-1237]MBD2136854.1 hypothetical protein [Anabaena sp. FACHB-1237]
MLGTFQQSQLRIEIKASADAIHDSLLCPENLQKWLLAEKFTPKMPEMAQMPEILTNGFEFSTSTGLVTINHHVDVIKPYCLRLLLSGAVDGFHEWYWGDGWIQSRLEGVSILPLKLAQTVSLLSLREFVTKKK